MKKQISKKMVSLIIIFIILVISTTSYAIYKVLSIGNEKLTFILKLSTINEVPPFTVNEPNLVTGMIPVIWNENDNKWQVVSESDPNWYNYIDINENGIIDVSEKKWANVMMPDTTAQSYSVGDEIEDSEMGSMFVWIPRYEYKVIYYTDSTKTTVSDTQTVYGKIDINFIEGVQTITTQGYTIHPAFTNGTDNNFANGEWDEEIEGIWVAKFEATTNSSGDEQAVPNALNNTTKRINEMYDLAKNSTFSLSSSDITLINSHMIKNSEWGALAYLSYSKYGVNEGNVYVNNYYVSNSTTITGYYASTYNSIGNTGGVYNNLSYLNYYNTTMGLNGSTTGTIYGIYDLVGGRTEFMASYLEGTTGTNNFISEGNTKYCTIYSGGIGSTTEEKIKVASKIGDSIKETYFFNCNSVGKANTGTGNYLTTPVTQWLTTTTPFIAHGGGQTNGYNGAGLSSFFTLDNSASKYRTYRTILIVE